jgi:hypothetical protein
MTGSWTRALDEAEQASRARKDHGVAIIVPHSHADAHERIVNWEFVRAHYAREHPTWPIVEGYTSTQRWRKGKAIIDALTRCTAKVLVIADADCLVDPNALDDAVERVMSNSASWVMPHYHVCRLNAKTTTAMLQWGSFDNLDYRLPSALLCPPYIGAEGGGIFVIQRIPYDAVALHGIFTRFVGWGGEDVSTAAIFDALLGPHYRGMTDLIHLWHTPQLKETFSGNLALFRQVEQLAHTLDADALWDALCALPESTQCARFLAVHPPRAVGKFVPFNRRTVI